MRAFTDAERLRLISMHKHRAGARGLERVDVIAIGFALNRRPEEVAVEILRLRMVGRLPFPSARKNNNHAPRLGRPLNRLSAKSEGVKSYPTLC
jgi:hypothetical protein